MKIENINSELLKKRIKLCVGAIVLGTIIAGVGANINNEQTIDTSEWTMEDYDENCARFKYNFINKEELTEKDYICIGEEKEDGIHLYTIDSTDDEDTNSHVPEGKFLLISDKLGTVEFEIDDKDSDYVANIDYKTKEMTIEKVKSNVKR